MFSHIEALALCKMQLCIHACVNLLVPSINKHVLKSMLYLHILLGCCVNICSDGHNDFGGSIVKPLCEYLVHFSAWVKII